MAKCLHDWTPWERVSDTDRSKRRKCRLCGRVGTRTVGALIARREAQAQKGTPLTLFDERLD